jgi:plastocyanin
MAAPDAPFAVRSSTKFNSMPLGSNTEPNMIPGTNANGTNTVIVNNARSYNPAIIDSTGHVKIAPPNASFTTSGNEQYVNSGWLIPKTQEKAYPGSSNTFVVTFQKSGSYGYLCELHPWMVGQVVVK